MALVVLTDRLNTIYTHTAGIQTDILFIYLSVLLFSLSLLFACDMLLVPSGAIETLQRVFPSSHRLLSLSRCSILLSDDVGV